MVGCCFNIQEHTQYEPHHEKTCLWEFGPCPTKVGCAATGDYYRPEISRDCAMYVAKTKALISSAVSEQLICSFVFTYHAKTGFLMMPLM